MCHRTHTSASDGWWVSSAEAAEETRSALLTLSSVGAGDTELCFTCHGVDTLGAEGDVQSAFDSSSGHRIAPDSSLYGPTVKQCSSCHDSHGSDRDVDSEPYPALLRVTSGDGDRVLSGDAFCGSCHADRSDDIWDGMDVWNTTAHAQNIPAVSGTGIVCSSCHDSHGSDIAPSIRTLLTPPSLTTTTSVTANDRSFCLSCHAAPSYSWPGTAKYSSGSHASSDATVAIPGEWPARDLDVADRSRRVGECQSCHAPMGRSNGDTETVGAIDKLLNKSGRELCDSCHTVNGPAETDFASKAFNASRVETEVAVVWRPSEETSIYGDVAVYTRDSTVTAPADLAGPRVFEPSGRTGDADSGDLDNDGNDEIVMADPSSPNLDFYKTDPVLGLQRTTVPIPGGIRAYLVAVDDIVASGAGPHGAQDSRAEIVVVERDPITYASKLHVFEFGAGSLHSITPVGGIDVGLNASSIATGDVTGTERADVVVTAANSDELYVFTEQSGAVAPITGSPFSTYAGPRGASIGDALSQFPGNEIVICNAGRPDAPVAENNISIYSGTGEYRGSFDTVGVGQATVAYDSAVANVLHGTNKAEVIVALRSDPTTDVVSATSSINVFSQTTGGNLLDTSAGQPQVYETGANFETSVVETGDVTGDGRQEIVVGNSGKWLRFGERQAPSLQIFSSSDGATLLTHDPLWSTGVEQASGIETTGTVLGAAPSVIVANLGPLGPSRHPIDAGEHAHVSTETVPVEDRHVTCADCHNVHETTATVAAAAPAGYGAIKGSRGTAVTNTGPGSAYSLTEKSGVDYEYELCLKCHASPAAVAGKRDIAAEVNPLNASTHAVQAPSTTASVPVDTFAAVSANTFVNNIASWTKDSVLYCIDCHTVADPSRPDGPHIGTGSSLLRKPYFGTLPTDSDLLCYLCHERAVYTGSSVTAESLFLHAPSSGNNDLHGLHVAQGGFSCRTCHVSHGSATRAHLQNDQNLYEHTEYGGACTNACHEGSRRVAYTRGAVTVPAELSVSNSGSVTNEVIAAVTSRDGVSLEVIEAAAAPGFLIEFTFTGLAEMPSGVEFYGRNDGTDAGHTIRVQAEKGVGNWVDLGTWPASATNRAYSFALNDPGFLNGNEMRIRVNHESAGDSSHTHYVDSVWLNP